MQKDKIANKNILIFIILFTPSSQKNFLTYMLHLYRADKSKGGNLSVFIPKHKASVLKTHP